MHSAMLNIHIYRLICVTSQPGKRFSVFLVIFMIIHVALSFSVFIKEKFGVDILFRDYICNFITSIQVVTSFN